MLTSIKEINYSGKIAFICDDSNLKEVSTLYKENVNVDVYLHYDLTTSIIENATGDIHNANKKVLNKSILESFSPFEYNAVVLAASNKLENLVHKCKSLATPVFTL